MLFLISDCVRDPTPRLTTLFGVENLISKVNEYSRSHVSHLLIIGVLLSASLTSKTEYDTIRAGSKMSVGVKIPLQLIETGSI